MGIAKTIVISIWVCAVIAIPLCTLSASAGQLDVGTLGSPQDVLTYHVDNSRSGWFSSENRLTPDNVNPKFFALLKTVTLDGRVDAEPLVVRNQTVGELGIHDVVYVATENNTLYAIDAVIGSILWKRHFGAPVPYGYKSDDNVFPLMGILGTPVIDRSASAIYLVTDTFDGKADVFTLHAIALSKGSDLLPPVDINFTANLSDGSAWTFNPRYQIQRPGLLESNGYIYVSFASNGDVNPDISRGTILRYHAATLTLASSQLTDKLVTPKAAYYLSSIWQSGYAPAADDLGDVYFSTGNSNPYRPSYSTAFNRPDSVVHLLGDLSQLLDSFTPADYFSLDKVDADLGSGGVMLLPAQPGPIPHLVVAGGKDGRAFLLNRDHLGGYDPRRDHVVQTVTMGACWCGPAYYVSDDGSAHVVTSGGNGVTSWKLQIAPSAKLVQESSTGPAAVSGLPYNGGSIPVVSSSGPISASAIVWFVQKPATSSDQDPGTPVTLRAYAASDLTKELVALPAGKWTHAVNSNANLVPTVVNGRVYVASNKQLRIFGLLAHKTN